MFKNRKHICFCATLVLLSGCANYSASSLSTLSSSAAVPSAKNSNITAAWKVFDKNDCQTYLGRNLLAEGYVPVQMTIRNQSEDPLYLSADNFSISLPSPARVAKTVHTSTGGRVAAWGIPGLIITPLLIPAIYDGILSSNANDSLDADYQSKALSDHIIQPHSHFDTIIFVPKGKIKQSIEMFLINETTQEKIVIPILKNGQACL